MTPADYAILLGGTVMVCSFVVFCLFWVFWR